MELLGLNLLGILACTIIGMALGALWYSPVLFRDQWLESIGKTVETLGNPTSAMIGSVFASFATAVGVSLIFSFIAVDSLGMGISVGLILGCLIIFPALLSDNLFCGWGNQILLIQSGYRIICVLLMSIALVYIL